MEWIYAFIQEAKFAQENEGNLKSWGITGKQCSYLQTESTVCEYTNGTRSQPRQVVLFPPHSPQLSYCALVDTL